MKMNNDPNWLREQARREDGCEVGAGASVSGMSNADLLQRMDPALSEYKEALWEIESRLRDAMEALTVAREIGGFVKPFGLDDEGPNSEYDRWRKCRIRLAALREKYFLLLS